MDKKKPMTDPCKDCPGRMHLALVFDVHVDWRDCPWKCDKKDGGNEDG